MQAFYFVKQDLFGIRKGQVERFREHVVAQLLREGSIEPFDPKKHGDAPGADDALVMAPPRAR